MRVPSRCSCWCSSSSELDAARRSGSQRLCGTSEASSWTRPDFDSPCGASALVRFVQVITGTIALNGTPATVAFQTAPAAERDAVARRSACRRSRSRREPGEELASCPARRAARRARTGRRRRRARARRMRAPRSRPARGTASQAAPCPGARPPRPWKSITAGQPPVGGVPSGSVSEQASVTPSLRRDRQLLRRRRERRAAPDERDSDDGENVTLRRPTASPRVAGSRIAEWILALSASSTRASAA